MNHQYDRDLLDAPTRSCLHIMSDENCRQAPTVNFSRRRLRRTSSLVAIVATIATLSSTCSSAFVSRTVPSGGPRSTLTAKATKTSTKRTTKDNVVEQLEPKTSISDDVRQKAVDAMRRNAGNVELDAKMLELLSDSFLVSPNFPPAREKPYGRPSMVAGAMNFETMLKFQERTEALDMIHEQFSSVLPYTNGDGEQNPKVPEDLIMGEVPAKAKKNRVKGEVKGSKMHAVYEDGAKSVKTLNENPDLSGKKQKKGYKNLPQKQNRDVKYDKNKVSRKTKGSGSKASPLDLSRYYRTELLTAEEEYTLGMQVRFMVKCEQVHEGLSLYLGRLPSIEEWASACGFVEEDKLFVATEADEQLRPPGSEDMFEETDPNIFVGNGLASSVGVGRGRGRVKKPPPMEMIDFFDDSSNKFRERGTPRIPKAPINRGTPTDFVEMLMEASEAKQRMVSSNMRLVVSIARKYSNVGVNVQDLIQEGSLGLSRAAEKFEPKKGFKFSTYASWWIQQAVFRSIAYHSRTIRLPVHIHNLLNRIRKVRKNLEQELGRGPTNEEIAFELDMSVEKYNKMLLLTRRSISLETPKYQQNPKDLGHESEDVIGDTIAASQLLDDCSPEQGVDRTLFHEDLRGMLMILEPDERRVICSRYGLDDGLTRTVTAVASQMKQPKAWVRSQECRALRKLRRPWYEKRLKEHQDSLSC